MARARRQKIYARLFYHTYIAQNLTSATAASHRTTVLLTSVNIIIGWTSLPIQQPGMAWKWSPWRLRDMQHLFNDFINPKWQVMKEHYVGFASWVLSSLPTKNTMWRTQIYTENWAAKKAQCSAAINSHLLKGWFWGVPTL